MRDLIKHIQEADVFKPASARELKKRQVNSSVVYNVWIEVERIDEASDTDTEDVFTEKLAKFQSEEEAIAFAGEVMRAHQQ